MHDQTMTDSVINTSRLTRHFGDVRAVENLSLSVPRSSVYAFLGPNGSGKTTTIRMILRLIHSDQGEIRLFGRPLDSKSRCALLTRVGAMVETPSLYPHLTGFENLRATQQLLAVPPSFIERSLGIVGLQADAARLVREYSSGMRQRLGVALSLLTLPELLILDEPTNGLDPGGMLEMRELIRRLPSEHGITVFLSSHLLAEVEHLATHVGIIGQGRLLFEGTLEALRGRQRPWMRIEVDKPRSASVLLPEAGCTLVRIEDKAVLADVGTRENVPRLATALVRAGFRLYEISAVQPSLEDIFLELTKDHKMAPVSLPAEVAR
jgi:ABC-type multidrug transport system ATPase subunit